MYQTADHFITKQGMGSTNLSHKGPPRCHDVNFMPNFTVTVTQFTFN